MESVDEAYKTENAYNYEPRTVTQEQIAEAMDKNEA
eukprot:CAMPEP_0170469716 /NCGR_PEP_ID=MMETSP0123-20130129/12455_1 /TAXON_ID=182087 /ORGANISM="Favella ehrenbergii, Strain Fehren 1" /LENGTH=35 /DNA_ID= /DNA_START= /DNA_END= /DNA_ORIENTATION=